ncbi:MAG: tryptophan--tRNA ligase [Polyangiales bacterium]
MDEAKTQETSAPQPKKGPPPRVFSGMQPSGTLHLGNYMGALRVWVDLVEESKQTGADLIFCIVDQHAVTVDYEPKDLRARVLDAAICYLAAGIDPSQCKLFLQSHVPEHTELAWYFNTIMPMGELSRMTQFKEKSEQHRQIVSAGVFTYPLLMAADILLYRATLVPVGEDQVQHIELARETARKFNARFTPKRARPTFPEPQHRLSTTPRIMGLDGQHKMSKSRGNDIGLLEDDASIKKKLKGAFTDPQRLTREDPGRPEVCNIFTMHKAVSPPALVEQVDVSCRTAGWGCGDCKEALAKSLSETLTPIRTKAEALRRDPEQVLDALADGAHKCRALAKETMREVRDRMGLVPAKE